MAWLAETSGWLGALTILAAYAAFSMGLIHNGRLFQAANLAGSAAMLVNAAHHGAWPTVTTSGAWCVISLVTLARLRRLDQPAPPDTAPEVAPGQPHSYPNRP
ncbi:CBU_0592 family membrane protein [Arthrobacter mobilis]|uniref:CBU-0592-like domain-containing protein n=1 Tax=Arthrobacter mobilis TaxID=2724944 RepID=A0A7X6K7E7_9MICC|nr:hypothetical protein [Arthrobacter mobilis]NKX56529.1 hypothetical protein [Arthrobacter mobilis]